MPCSNIRYPRRPKQKCSSEAALAVWRPFGAILEATLANAPYFRVDSFWNRAILVDETVWTSDIVRQSRCARIL
jgi:hypothetical protein